MQLGFVTDDLRALFAAKIQSSGLDLADAVRLGFTILDIHQVTAIGIWNGFARMPAFSIHYVDPWNEYTGFYRYRALRVPVNAPKFPKYTQPKGSPVHAYFPTIGVKNWAALLADPSKSLIITEGELKAAKACKEGFPTISIGGVWSFQSKQKQIDFLPELDRIEWKQRTVFIAYDSDASTKPEVMLAEQALANHLIQRGAIVMKVSLPQLGNEKTGLDDFIVARGIDALRQLLINSEQMSFEWRLLYQRTDAGPIHSTANVVIALQNAPELREAFGYDLMRLAPAVVGPFLDLTAAPPQSRRWFLDDDVLRAQVWLQAEGGLTRIPKQTVADAIDRVARQRAFHPVRDWLQSLSLGKKLVLSTWLHHTVGAPDDEYHRAIGRMFIISLVARVFIPGCKADYMLVLEDTQGLLKSTLFRELVGDEWFSDDLPDIDRDPIRLSQHMRGVWLFEISELGTIRKADTQEWKRFQTRQYEIYTPKYGRAEVHEPRQCCFAGTTNDDIYLRDETGNRRFWPVVMVRPDRAWLAANREQLFAEAYQAFFAGEHWWPDEAFEKKYIKPEQDARFSGGEWDEDIQRFINLRRDALKTDRTLPNHITTTDVATGLSIELTRRNSETFRRISSALKRLGCEKRKSNGRWLYEFPRKK